MTLIGLIITLLVVGVILWLINTQLAPYVAPPIVKIINIVVVIVVVLWLLQAFGLLNGNDVLNTRIGK
jgi:hypothetical protein